MGMSEDSTGAAIAQVTQAASMAAMAEQLKNVVAQLDRSERTLGKLDDISKTVIELKVLQENTKSTIARAFERVEEVETRSDENAQAIAELSNALATKASTEDVAALDRKASAFMDRIKGGLLVAGFVVTLVQGGLIAGVVWLISTTQNGQTTNQLQQQTIDRLDREQDVIRRLVTGK